MAAVLSVRNLAKRYMLGATASHDTLRDQIALGLKSMFGKSAAGGPAADDFWALRDVSFEVRQGEVLGVIGRNGAGKSTLLKILSQITEPTEGEVLIRGRVSSLLEVGTGFHQELTGRENVYLNGALLGMSRAEIRRKFDEIVEFAEVDKFLDTPVKRYSSGMYVRLAFAVAAHLEPEILIVDEVLAVGDAQFQNKCLGKMEDVSRLGRTVLFVSHNMTAVESLCTRAILLESGRLCMDAPVGDVVQRYFEASHSGRDRLAGRTDRKGNGAARAAGFCILDGSGLEQPSVKSGGDCLFEIAYQNDSGAEIADVAVSLDFFDDRNLRILLLRSDFTGHQITLRPGRGVIRCGVADLPLANGLYRVSIYLSARGEAEVLDWIEDAAPVAVIGGDFFGTGNPGLPHRCKVFLRADWSAG